MEKYLPLKQLDIGSSPIEGTKKKEKFGFDSHEKVKALDSFNWKNAPAINNGVLA